MNRLRLTDIALHNTLHHLIQKPTFPFFLVKPEDSFDEVIVRPVPVRKPIPSDPEVIVEDEQTFLLRQQQLLSKV